MAGLRVRQAFGVFLVLGLGVGSSSPQVLRHPTSMYNSGINNTGTMDLNTKKGINTVNSLIATTLEITVLFLSQTLFQKLSRKATTT